MAVLFPTLLYPPYVGMPTHIGPGTAMWFSLRTNHTAGETLTGIKFLITSPDGAIGYFTFEKTGLSVSVPVDYEELLVIPSWIPQNTPLRAYARTQGLVNGVPTWSTYHGGGTLTFTSSNTPPTSTPIYPNGTITISGSSTSLTATARFSDTEGDNIYNVRTVIEKLVSGTYQQVGDPAAVYSTGLSINGQAQIAFPSLGVGTYRWRVAAADVSEPVKYGAYSSNMSFTIETGTVTPPPSGGTPPPDGGGGTPPPAQPSSPIEDTSYSFAPQGNIPASASGYTFSGNARFKDTDSASFNAYDLVIEKYTSGVWTTQYSSGTQSFSGSPGVAFSFTAPGTLTTGISYRWKIKVRDSSNLWSNYSNPRTFVGSTTAGPNTTPTASQSTPDNAQVLDTLTPTFTGAFSDTGITNNIFSKFQVEVSLNASPNTIMSQIVNYATDAQKTSNTFSYTYTGTPLAYSTVYRWRLKVWDNANAESAFTGYRTFTTPPPPAPVTPTDLSPAGIFATNLPVFSATYSSPVSATQTHMQVVVYENAAGTTVMWDSGMVVNTTGSMTYAGSTAFTPNKNIWWKVRFTDSNGQISPYSSLQAATETSAPSVPIDLWPRNGTVDVWPQSVVPTFGGTHVSASNSNAKAVDLEIILPFSWSVSTQGLSSKRVHAFSSSLTSLTAGTTVTWRMRTQSADTGFWSPWTAVQTFKVNLAPGAPSLTSPSEASKLVTLTPTIDWGYVNSDSSVGTFVPNGRIQAFAMVDLKDTLTGVSLPGYPKPTAQFYHDFSTPLDSEWIVETGVWSAGSSVLTVNNTPNATILRNAYSSSGYLGCYIKHLNTTKTGLIFRRTDSKNFWAVVLDGEYLRLYKVMGGAFGSPVQSFLMDVIDEYYQHIVIGMIGPQITVYLNGQPVITGITDRYNSNGTQHGCYVNGSSSAGFKDLWFATQRAQDSEYSIPAGVLSLEKTYTWKVKSYDGFVFGPYN